MEREQPMFCDDSGNAHSLADAMETNGEGKFSHWTFCQNCGATLLFPQIAADAPIVVPATFKADADG